MSLGNTFLEGSVGRALLGAVTQRIIGVGTHQQTARSAVEYFFWANYDNLFERYLHDMVEHESPEPGDEPEFRIMGNYATHYFNVGYFKRGPFPISSYMQPILQELTAQIVQWDDNKILDTDVKNALTGSGRVGSGSGVGGTLAERLEKKWKQKGAKYTEVQKLLKESAQHPDWGPSVYEGGAM